MRKVLYPLFSQLDYTELKYSLRSIEKYMPGCEIIIVGSDLPDWITNVTHINLGDLPGQRVFSVRRKVLAGIEYAGEVFFMNDDFYLLKEPDFIYYSSGLLDNKGESGARPLRDQLKEHQKPTRYFGHYPCIYGKDFTEIISLFTRDCITKSAYCNFINIDPVEIKDCKLINPTKPQAIKEFIKNLPSFSTGVRSLKSCLPILEELFPKPSQYEL